jgi:hypothetical protein
MDADQARKIVEGAINPDRDGLALLEMAAQKFTHLARIFKPEASHHIGGHMTKTKDNTKQLPNSVQPPMISSVQETRLKNSQVQSNHWTPYTACSMAKTPGLHT